MKKAILIIGLSLALIGAAGGNNHHHQWVIYRTQGYGGYLTQESPYEYTITRSVICPDCGEVRELPSNKKEN